MWLPQRLKRLKNGDQIWEFDFQGEESQCVTYAVTFNAEDELETAGYATSRRSNRWR